MNAASRECGGEGRLRRSAVLILLAVLASPLAAQSVRERLAAAEAVASDKKPDEAAKLFMAIGDDAKLKADDRLRAYARAADLFRRQKNYDDAADALRKQLEIPSVVSRQKSLRFAIADVQAAGGKVEAAVATLTDLARQWPDDPDTVTQAHLNAAAHLGRAKQFAKAADAYQQAFDAMGEDDPRAADTLWNVSQNHWVAEQWEPAAAAAMKLIDERYRDWPRGRNGEANDRVMQAYLKLKRPGQAIAQLTKWEASDPNPAFRQRWCLRAAQTAVDAGDQAAALQAYRRLFTAHAAAGSTEGWWDAQNAITDSLVDKSPAEAIKHAHLLLDAAGDTNQLTAAVQKTAALMQKLDGNKDRARQFVAFQLYGPNGRDKKPGTADDPKDPLGEVGYPKDAERTAAFAKAFAEVGDDAAATFHRGQMCLYSGKPAAAYALFAQAARRAGHDRWATYAGALAMNGLRVQRGHGSIEDAAKWLLNGQGDDPFKIADASPPWPVPALSGEDKQNLTAVLAALRGLVTDQSLSADTRAAALRGAGLAMEALDLHPPGEPFHDLAGESAAALRDAGMAMVLRLERGGEIHAGKVRTFLAADKLGGQAQKRIESEWRRVSKPLDRLTSRAASTPRVQPIK